MTTRVEAERRRRGWTQTRLAASADMHQGQLSLIERGRLRPTEAQARKLADVLGVPSAHLLDEIPDPAETVS